VAGAAGAVAGPAPLEIGGAEGAGAAVPRFCVGASDDAGGVAVPGEVGACAAAAGAAARSGVAARSGAAARSGPVDRSGLALSSGSTASADEGGGTAVSMDGPEPPLGAATGAGSRSTVGRIGASTPETAPASGTVGATRFGAAIDGVPGLTGDDGPGWP
jgi:hypothetical protein